MAKPKVIIVGKQEVLVDEQDAHFLESWKWSIGTNGHVERRHHVSGSGKNRVRESWKLSRKIMDAPKGMEVDHINRNPLDNTRSNLRLCKRSENNSNRLCKSKSGLKGVVAKGKRFIAQGGRMGFTNRYLGSFGTAKEAALAYDSYARAEYGEFALTNFSKENI